MNALNRFLAAAVVAVALAPAALAAPGSNPAADAKPVSVLVSTSKSVVSVSAPAVRGDESITLTLTSVDRSGTPLQRGGLHVVFRKEGGTSTGLISAATDRGDGTYTALFRGVTTGTPTRILATINGEEVGGEAPTVTVLPRLQQVVTTRPPGSDGSTDGDTATSGPDDEPPPPDDAEEPGDVDGPTPPTEPTTPPDGGGTTPPPDDGGTTTPPDDGGTSTPPDDGGTSTPPDDGGTTTPPDGGGTTSPPDDGGTTTPPDDGGTTTPPDDGGTTTPPDGGGTQEPPTDGSGGPISVEPAIIRPGTGFVGATAQPARIEGQGMSATQKPVARWDTVPFQTFTSDLNVAVLAFHSAGMDRVEFSANGGPWAPVTRMTLNPQSGVVEFWATLRPTDFGGDGAVEVRAIAYPKVGVPRVLDPLWLTVNGRGTLTAPVRYVSPASRGGSDTTGDGSRERPFATIVKAVKAIEVAGGGKADGGTVYLLAGDHVLDWPGTPFRMTNRWLTVTAAPGLTRSQVAVTGTASSGGAGIRLLRLSNLTLRWDSTGGSAPRLRNNPSMLPNATVWLENVYLKGYGRAAMSAAKCVDWVKSREFTGGIYYTECLLEDSPNGMTQALLNRNCVSRRIISDHFQNNVMIVNCVAEDTSRDGTSAHGDIYQLTNKRLDNGIIYGLTAVEAITSGQGLYYSNDRNDSLNGIIATSIDGLAIVNTRVRMSTPGRSFSVQCPTNNLIMQGNEITGGMNAPYGPAWKTASSSGADGFVGTDAVVFEVRDQFPEAENLSVPPPGVHYVEFVLGYD